MRGTLEGHSGWVTSLATSLENPQMLLSGSRDKTLIIWNLARDDTHYGYPKRSLHGHSHIVSDCVMPSFPSPPEYMSIDLVLICEFKKVISSDGAYALSASWDKTLRLWELATGVTTRRFVGHTNDVLSVSFSADNRQIVSGSRDRTIKLWNTLGDCKFTITDKGHTEWVSCVRFSPNPQNPVIVSAGWDKLVKVCFRIRWQAMMRGREFLSEDAFAIYKYLLLQSFRAMRQTITNALMTTTTKILELRKSLRQDIFADRILPFIGLGTCLLPHPNRPHRPHWLHQYRDHLPRRLPVCLGRQRRHNHALGSQRIQTPLLPERRRRDPRPRLLPEPILAVRRDVELHHHLRSREEEQGRRVEARIYGRG